MNIKQNCWEYKKCGREPNGHNVRELGVCPAAIERRLDGVHNGINAGRSCWVIAGTFCCGIVEGTFAQKYSTCKDCDFYQLVQAESYQTFKVSTGLLQKLREHDRKNMNELCRCPDDKITRLILPYYLAQKI